MTDSPRSTRDLPRVQTQVFRNRTNWRSGLILEVMAVVLWFLFDPWQVAGPLPADEALGAVDAMLTTWGLGLMGALGLGLLWFPRVEVHQEVVIVYNPIRLSTIARTEITGTDTSRTYTEIKTVAGSVRCIGLENSLAMQLQASPNSSTAKTASALEGPEVQSGSTPVAHGIRIQVRRMTRLETMCAVTWFLIGIASLFVV